MGEKCRSRTKDAISVLGKKLKDTVHVAGLRRLLYGKGTLPRQCVWGFLLGASTIFLLYHITALSVHYSYQTPIPITKSVDADYLEFPAITVCNNNFLLKSMSSLSTLEILRIMYHSPVLTGDDDDSGHSAELFSAIPDLDNSGWLRFYTFGQHKMNKMLVKCYFQGEPCDVSDFRPVLTDMGLCYTFNLHHNPYGERLSEVSTVQRNVRTSKYPGRTGGLQLLLTAQQEEYLLSLGGLGAGFSVRVHHPGTTVREMANIGLHAGVGMETTFQLQADQREQQFSSQGCLNTEPSNSTAGARENCLNRCFASYITSQCGCTGYDLLSPPDVKICHPFVTKACLIPASRRYPTSKEARHCLESECPRHCKETSYSVSLSTQRPLSDMAIADLGPFFPYTNFEHLRSHEFELFFDMMGLNLTERQYWAKNAVSLNMYYPEMKAVKHSHQSNFSFVIMLSHIGGAFSLFLGASLLTIAEAFDVMVCLIMRLRQQH